MPNILVVDDEKEIVQILETFLTKNRYRVFTATNGTKTLEIISAAQPIDLLIIDIIMPGMRGLDVLKKAKELSKNIPTIILRGSVDIEEFRADLEALGLSEDDTLLKPVDLNQLLKKIREKLSP